MNFIIRNVLGVLNLLRIQRYNKYFWNLRAKDINEKWGSQTHDYSILRKIILDLKADKILDVGCGSGRLFPLYDELRVSELVAQDISDAAIELAKNRAEGLQRIKITFEDKEITVLNFPDSYFDLVVSNRTLSAVFPKDIREVVIVLCKISNHIYINEMSYTDYHPSAYWFQHDYLSLMEENSFRLVRKELDPESKQQWYLFSKIHQLKT